MQLHNLTQNVRLPWQPYAGTPICDAAIRTWGPKIAELLSAVGLDFSPRDGYLPLPGLYAIMSGAGGGKSTMCRQLDEAVRSLASGDGVPAEYAFVNVGEPEDPKHVFESVFPELVNYINSRPESGSSKAGEMPSLLIIDSLTDLAFQELPRAPRTSASEVKDAVSKVQAFGSDRPGGILDLALRNPSIYFAPNTAAMSGGLTGSYYQILKRLSIACTNKGVYMFGVINPLTFDDKSKFRQAVLGSCAAAVSIDQFDAGLARCVKVTGTTINYRDAARFPIANRRVSATSAEVQDLFTSLLNGGDNV